MGSQYTWYTGPAWSPGCMLYNPVMVASLHEFIIVVDGDEVGAKFKKTY